MKNRISQMVNSIGFLILIVVLVFVGMVLITSGLLTYDTIPPEATLVYRTVEPGTGGFLFSGGAQYFVFDEDGQRYSISQSTFDSYADLPRQ